MQFTANPEFCQALQIDPTLQRVTPGSRDSMTPTQSLLRQVKADLVHGLETNGEITGVVVLGSKQNGLMYSAEDLTFLTALGQVTGIALHCANVHQNLKHLNEELRSKVDQLAQQKQQIAILQAELSTNRIETQTATSVEFRRESIIGHSPSIGQVLDMVRKVAPSDTNVLIRGESGTGKELLATAIHDNSPRRSGPLVSVHCAALSAGLLESELFGHVQGSFTGAHADKQGRFELANGGSLFLDEIGDISLEIQIKLLRVLQQREFERVGGTQTIQVDVRLIAATHQNLERLISEGKFREDLYYRLNVISIVVPPLRERSDDVLDLAVFFLKAASTRSGKRIARFGDDALNALMQYSWPGNIRELQNVIERAVVLAERDTIELMDLPFPIQSLDGAPRLAGTVAQREMFDVKFPSMPTWYEENPDAERQLLMEALQQCKGNKTKAARKLGLPRSTYFSKLKKFGIVDDEPAQPPRYGKLPR
jgi:transcriptional regulator with GAF, ATPase, and Fis domain